MANHNGTPNRDIWNGASSADTAHGNGGDDSLYGKGGNDILYGDAGNDGLYGDDGNDTLYGGDGVDALFGGTGSDTLRGGNGDDYILGGIGDDGLYGEAGKDRLRGEDGVDALFGGSEDDDLDGGRGDDYLDGGTGNDTLYGGEGNDRLRGGDGNDYLHSGPGNDDLQGDNGNDTLVFYARSNGPQPNETAIFNGGEGRDELILDVQGAWTEDGARLSYVSIGSSGKGSLAHVTDPIEPSGTWVGELNSIESIRVAPGGNGLALYANRDLNVIGSDKTDYMEAFLGDQTFDGGGGPDYFRYILRIEADAGYDIVRGFKASEGDVIQFNTEDYSTTPDGQYYDEFIHTSSREVAGHTIYTTVDTRNDQVIHTLDVDAVGLPLPGGWLLG